MADNKTFVYDADGLVLGRLASTAADLLLKSTHLFVLAFLKVWWLLMLRPPTGHLVFERLKLVDKAVVIR